MRLAKRNEKVLAGKGEAGAEHPGRSSGAAAGLRTHPEKILGFCREMVTAKDWADLRAWELGGIALGRTERKGGAL